jgi:RHS repeat-associated protein
VIEPETGATLMGYDAAGNLAWSASGLPAATACDAEGGTTAILARKVVRQYDARNRIVALRFPDGLGDQDWQYTADGLPDRIVTYNGPAHTLPVTNAYAYNRRRLLTGESSTYAEDGSTWVVGYGYDASAHLASQTYPDDRVVQYAPNALGQATRVDSGGSNPEAWGASYYPNGGLKQFTYGNGIVHTLLQNARGLPERSTDAYGSTKFLDDAYDYDPNGNVLAITDGATGRNQRGNRDMTYDGLDRLTAVDSPMYGSTGAAYAYDVLDNLTRVRVPDRNYYYCYDDSNRLTNIKIGGCDGTTVTGLGYDVQGNLANRSGTQYAFDFGNRLRRVTYNDVTMEAYRYDGRGLRVRATSADGAIASFYSQGGQLLYQENRRDGKTHGYYYLAGSLVDELTRDTATGAYANRFQHTDALGSPVAVTNEPRTVLERSEYEPYGKLLNRPLADGPGYAGHVADAATGLSYMQQRYYDPRIGVFLSVDPVTANSSTGTNFNRYWYAENNPYKFADPDGRQSARAAAYQARQQDVNGVWGILSTYGGGASEPSPHAEITTYMNLGATTYRDSDGNFESYESRNEVSKRSAPGADAPYESADTFPVKGPLHNNPIAYGPNSVILTMDYARGRWLHGGGTGLPDPLAPRQGWKPTLGCTRLQNQDIEKLANNIRGFKARHPGTPVPYHRVMYVRPIIVPVF